MFVEIFPDKSILEESCITLPAVPSKNNLKLDNIPVIPKMFNKVITYLDYCEISAPDCIQELFLKSYELDFSYISIDVFNMGLK